MKRALSSSVVLGLLAVGCGGSAPEAAAPTSAPASSSTVTAVTPPPASSADAKPAADEAKKEEPKAPLKKPVAIYSGFQTPESVLVDGDRYLVSNINGSPFAKDNNGFISVIDAKTGAVAEKWIEGGKNKVTLNAPKGSTIAKGILYVADIDVIRKFDAKTGAPKGEIAVKGATFLNDVASSSDGASVYFTDSGFKQGEKGEFAPSLTDAVYMLKNGKVDTIAKSDKLHGPNGILPVESKSKTAWESVAVAPFSSKIVTIYSKNPYADAKIMPPAPPSEHWGSAEFPAGMLDGLAEMDGSTMLVSSWEGKAVYRLNADGKVTTEVDSVEAPADIAYDKARHLLLIPRFMGNIVEAYDVK